MFTCFWIQHYVYNCRQRYVYPWADSVEILDATENKGQNLKLVSAPILLSCLLFVYHASHHSKSGLLGIPGIFLF